jgi:transcriptional regulator with XRE-family HTH domain
MKTATTDRVYLDRKKMRVVRARRDMTGDEVCSRLRLDGRVPSRATFYAWENGYYGIPRKVLGKLCRVLGVKESEISA